MVKKVLRKIGFLVSVYHFLFAFCGALYYRFPSSRMKVLGVTGTNGKTTVVDLTSRIFKEAGYKVAVFSSIKFEIAGEEEINLYKMTMPGRAVLQRLLRKAADKGCEVVIMEVTSEGIKQHRHRFIRFFAACFTNLSLEHIESHGGFENYKKAKGKLFRATKYAHVINIDDENANYFLQFKSKRKICYNAKENNKSLPGNTKALQASGISSSKRGIEFMLGKEKIFLPLKGSFNAYNALAAIGLSALFEIEIETAKRALSGNYKIPGRMEEVISSPFRVIVDYAVTPDALEGVYREITFNFSPRKLIAVLGACGGGRDRWKRPELGKIAAKYCDKIILTNEDPYNENPEKIIEDIFVGTKRTAEKITDRRGAIKRSLELAKEGDIIIITGKGSEPWLCMEGGKKIAWNEEKIVREEFKKIHRKHGIS